MNQQQFDRDDCGDGFNPDEVYQNFHDNPMRRLFENAARQQSERSHLDHYKPKHPVIDYPDEERLDRETYREIASIRRRKKK